VQRWIMVGAAAAAAAVSLLVVGTTGGGPSSAFAGWTPDPSLPAAGQLQAGESVCASDPSLARLTPTLTDTRGPYSAFLYAQAGAAAICVVGPGLTATNPEDGPIIVNGGAPSTASIAPGTISTRGPLSMLLAPTVEFGAMAGQVGRGVTAVKLSLDDGSNVEATIKHGWFAAWWPTADGVKSADLTTTTGSTTQPLNLPKPLHCIRLTLSLSRCKAG